MIPLFIGLSLVNLLCLTLATALGYATASGAADWGRWHILAGALAAIVCCGVHCVVFTYFVATGKWVAHAILVKGLEPKIAEAIRPLRRTAFAAALSVIVLAVITAIVGAAVDNQYVSPVWHHLL